MPPELLPIDRKDFLKERRPSSSEPVEIVPARWRESPTTPSSHPNNGPLSCRWGGGGPSDFRRPFTGPRVSADIGSQKDRKGGNFWEPSASPNGNSHPQSDFVNSWDQLQSNDQNKNNTGGVRLTGGQSQTLNKSNSLGSSLDWKPLKWARSGSLSSRGSESPQLGNSNLVQSPAGDTAPCVTPRTPDEANSRKKARLGWGEGLAKYEKKKVDPDDIIDDVSTSEPSNSPTTSCSFACSSSPAVADHETCNASNVFNLENLELTENFCMNSLLGELLQSDDTGFAMEKLQVWKADITKTLEITETDIDSLENELKSLIPASEIQKPVEDLNRESPGTATSKLMETNSAATEKTDSVVDFGIRENKLYDAILASNKLIAKQACDEISKILPTADKICASIIRVNDAESLVEERIYMRKRFLKFKEKVTTLKFRAFHYSWKKDLHKHSVRKNGAKPSSRVHTRSCSPVPTEYVKKLLSDSQVKPCRNVQKMPTFILDKSVRTISRFISDNGLVENPIEVEKEKLVVKPWTEEEKKIFLEKYDLFGKNFKKISSFLPNKTVADCVEFYYKNHKSDLFQKTKKKPEFSKGKSYTANTYLLTSGKQRLNRETRATTSAILSEQSTDFSMFCDDQEAAAADVLAGICGSISPEEALGSCVTSLADNNNNFHHRVRSCQKIKEETCSDDSCGEEIRSSHWTDEEKLSFVTAVKTYGKDFSMISRFVRTRWGDECKVYFSKARGILGLDFENGSEGTTGANQGGGDGDHDDTCMVDSGSGISNENPSTVDLRTSDCRESEEILVLDNKPAGNGNLEGAADVAESPKNTCSDSASGAKVEGIKVCSDSEINLDLNTVSENVEAVDSFVMSNLFPEKEVGRKTVSQDDVSSRLSSGQRSSSIDLHLSKRNFKLDEKLLMPRDGCLQMSTDMMTPVPIHEQRIRSSSWKNPVGVNYLVRF